MTSTHATWIHSIVATIAVFFLGLTVASDQFDQVEPLASREPPDDSAILAVTRVSGRFVNLLVARQVERQQFMQEYVLGTLTTGPVFLRGTVTAELVPYSNHAALDIHLVGTTECRNHVGERGPIMISSSAAGQIDVRKRVLIDNAGIQAAPAAANCTAQVEIHDISAQRRVVERIAWRRAKRMHDEIEQAAAETSGSRTEQELDLEMSAPLAEAEKVLSEKFGSSWSKKIQTFPMKVALSSTQHALQAALVASDSSPIQPPQQLRADWDVFFCLHQSCFERLAHCAMSGKTIADTEFLDAVQIATGNAPRQLWVHDRVERWSVVAANERPVTGTFVDNKCSIAFRFQQVTRGAEHFDRPLEVSAHYALEITKDGPHLIRNGDVVVRFSDPGAATENDESFREFVRSKFTGVFQPEIYFDGLVPPAGGSMGKLRALQLQELSCRDGWLSIGYQLPVDTRRVAQLAN